MAEFPSLPLFTDAYLGDTTHLSTFEHGAYLLLLIVSWRSAGCCLPDDDALLARYARMTRDKWRRTRPILAPFFTIEDGFWHQARLQDEFQHLQSQKVNASNAGKASAVAKALKRANRGSTTVGQPLQRNANDQSTPIPIPTIQLDNSNCGGDSDKQFWEGAKVYLGKGKASLIGQWVRDHGKEATAAAITAAQLERAVDPIQFIQGRFRKQSKAQNYDRDRITV
jgi:uncharacterized protein YdaU (DUF1376 family)